MISLTYCLPLPGSFVASTVVSHLSMMAAFDPCPSSTGMPKSANHETPYIAARGVIRRLEQASETLDERVKFVFKKRDWDIGRRHEKLPPLQEFTTSLTSQVSRDYHRLKYMSSLLQAMATSVSELEQLYDAVLEPIAMQMSKGLSSLPDEILSLIVKFAASDEHKGTKHAIWISQVSRRFRRIALSDRCLWYTLNLWHDTTKTELDMIILRSGTECDLHVVINMNPSIPGRLVRSFMGDCSHTASRWRTMTVTGDWTEKDAGLSMDCVLGQLVKRYELTLPRLEELTIRERRFDDNDGSRVWMSSVGDGPWYEDSRPWVTPRLRTLRCSGFVPLASFPFTAIRYFVLSLVLMPSFVRDQIGKLVSFLPAMSSLTTFELALENESPYITDGPDVEFPHQMLATCPSVTTFSLRVSSFNVQVQGNELLETIVGSFRFPNITRFSLAIQLLEHAYSSMHRHPNDYLTLFLYDLLPDPANHPLVTALDLMFVFPKHAPEMYRTGENPVLNIPLDRIPNGSSLAVTACGQVLFSDERSLYLDPTAGPCCFRELRLHSCENMDPEFLQGMIQSLQDADAWETLERIVIEGCGLLDYDTASKAVGKKRLKFIQ